MFAKLFERNGQQALVIKTDNDEGEPVIQVMYEFELCRATTSVCFKTEETRDQMFEQVTAEQAFKFRQTTARRMGLEEGAEVAG